MEFRVLGPLEVLVDDRLVPLPRRKHRSLLAVLLIHAREPLSRDRLVDDLWGEHPPAAARGALHNYVSQLRRVIGAERIVRDPAGYALDVDDDQLDLGRFRPLVRESRAALATAERARKAREALALWRGPPLPDLVYEPFAALELPLLEEERLSVYKELLDAELELGRHGAILDEIDALVRSNPYDERLRRQLMLALYRAGRQADALEVFRDARQMLVDELGIEPGRELRSLERGILVQDAALDLRTGPMEGDAPSRKTVTILFAGLPEPPAGLDAEALHARQQRFHDSRKAAAEYHGGTVEGAGSSRWLPSAFPLRTRTIPPSGPRGCGAREDGERRSEGQGSKPGRRTSRHRPPGARVSGEVVTTRPADSSSGAPGEITSAKTVRLVREAAGRACRSSEIRRETSVSTRRSRGARRRRRPPVRYAADRAAGRTRRTPAELRRGARRAPVPGSDGGG
jgi:DNA-binding SARP family transcriptional activator